jgi:hypothetical protein
MLVKRRSITVAELQVRQFNTLKNIPALSDSSFAVCWYYKVSCFDCTKILTALSCVQILDGTLENYSKFQIAYFDTCEERQASYFVIP